MPNHPSSHVTLARCLSLKEPEQSSTSCKGCMFEHIIEKSTSPSKIFIVPPPICYLSLQISYVTLENPSWILKYVVYFEGYTRCCWLGPLGEGTGGRGGFWYLGGYIGFLVGFIGCLAGFWYLGGYIRFFVGFIGCLAGCIGYFGFCSPDSRRYGPSFGQPAPPHPPIYKGQVRSSRLSTINCSALSTHPASVPHSDSQLCIQCSSTMQGARAAPIAQNWEVGVGDVMVPGVSATVWLQQSECFCMSAADCTQACFGVVLDFALVHTLVNVLFGHWCLCGEPSFHVLVLSLTGCLLTHLPMSCSCTEGHVDNLRGYIVCRCKRIHVKH